MTRSVHLALSEVSKRLGGIQVLERVTFDVARGDLLGLLGPSGSGKTTLLNMIGGFLEPDSGRIELAGDDLSGQPPHRRDIGITFQKYALFPHMTVFDNVAYGLRQRRTPRDETEERVGAMLALLGLGSFRARYPRSLSGGEQQRVALARSLVVRPRLMLLDEPLANLDAALRQRVRFEIREVLRRTEVTSIFVTHDQEEAFALCDRVAVLHRGQIQQISSPGDLIERPMNAFVASFIGSPNAFSAKVESYDPGQGRARIRIDGFSALARAPERVGPGDAVEVFARSDVIRFTPGEGGAFRVKDSVHLTAGREVWLDGPLGLRARLADSQSAVSQGTLGTISWDPDHVHAFPSAAR